MNGKIWLAVGALVAGLAVGTGAWGAHGFEKLAVRLYEDGSVREGRFHNWEVAAQYQMYHGLALLAVGLAALHDPSRRWDIAAWLFVLGVLLFSGSLYAIALSGTTNVRDVPLGGVLIVATPVGGMCFLGGWLMVLAAVAGMRPVVVSGSAPRA